MGSEKARRTSPSVVGHRRRFSDITNIPLSTGWTKTVLSSQFAKGSAAQQQKEIGILKKKLEEKEKIIQADKRTIEAQEKGMEKIWLNYCRKSTQNDEIIQRNVHLHKDLMQARDKLKVLQHENTLMTAVHTISKSVLQLKLNEALEQVNRLQASAETSTTNEKLNFQKALTEIGKSRADKNLSICESAGGSMLNYSAKVTDDSAENPIPSKTTLRRKESKRYKDPTLNTKIRLGDTGGSCCKIDP